MSTSSEPLVFSFEFDGIERIDSAFRKIVVSAKKTFADIDKEASKQSTIKVKAATDATKETIRGDKRIEAERIKAEARLAAIKLQHESKLQLIRDKDERKQHMLRLRNAEKEARERSKFYGKLQNGLGAVGNKIGGVAKGATLGAAGLLTYIGYKGTDDSLEAGKKAREIVNKSPIATAEGRENARKQVLQISAEISNRTGKDKSEVTEFVELMQGSGSDIDTALALAPFVAELASASNGSMTEFADSSATIADALARQGLEGAELQKQTRKTLEYVANAAKASGGKIDPADISKQLGRITAAFANSAVSAADATPQAIGLMQIARRGTGSPEEAATAVTALTADLNRKSAKIQQKYGIDIYADKGKTKMRSLDDVALDIIEKTGGNQSKLTEIFGEQSGKLVGQLSKTYAEAKGTKEQKKEAVKKDIANLGGTNGGVAIDTLFAETMEDPSKKFELSMKKLENAMSDTFLPMLVEMIPVLQDFANTFRAEVLPAIQSDLIPALKSATPAIVDITTKLITFAGWLAKNPMEGLGVLISGWLLKELAAAGIAKAIAGALGGSAAGNVTGAAAGSGVGSKLLGWGKSAGKWIVPGIIAGGKTAGAAIAGAGAATIGAGAAAVGGVAAAGYQGYQAYEENKNSGGFWNNLAEAIAINNSGKNQSSEDFKKMIEAQNEQNRIAREQLEIARRQQNTAM